MGLWIYILQVHPEIGLKKFVPSLCQTILNRTQGIQLLNLESLSESRVE